MEKLHNWPEEFAALQEEHVALQAHCKKLEAENASLREENERLKNAPADRKAWSKAWSEAARKADSIYQQPGYQDPE
jgi:regulator of replication initiation timing